MALGKVTVTTSVAGTPVFLEPEGVALFIGEVTSGEGELQAIGRETDLVAMFGAALDLVDVLESARENGGPNWKAWAIGHLAAGAWDDVLPIALPGCSDFIEYLVLTKPLAAGAAITDIQTELTNQHNLALPLFALACTRAINNGGGGDANWAAYLAAMVAIPNAIAAPRVVVVPTVFGNDLGVFAGRLQKVLDERTPKISRSPMRVASGAVVNPGATRAELVDVTGAPLLRAHLETLDAARLSVLQWHQGLQGIYCADGNLLAAAASSDPPVIEWLRLLDKAERRIRTIADNLIADDEAKNTDAGNAATATRLSLPLRQMQALGEIQPGWTVAVSWTTLTKMKVQYRMRPPNSPKEINNEITLDTSAEG